MSDVVVVDASLAIKWVRTEPDSPQAIALLNQWLGSVTAVIVPSLFPDEITNVLHKHIRKGEISLDDAKQGIRDLLSIGLVFDSQFDPIGAIALCTRALELANQLGLPATYDAHYLALAERQGCELWTADERLWNSVKSQLAWVRWLGETRKPSP